MRPPRRYGYTYDLQARLYGPLWGDAYSINLKFFCFCRLLVARSDFHAKPRLFCGSIDPDFDLYTALLSLDQVFECK